MHQRDALAQINLDVMRKARAFTQICTWRRLRLLTDRSKWWTITAELCHFRLIFCNWNAHRLNQFRVDASTLCSQFAPSNTKMDNCFSSSHSGLFVTKTLLFFLPNKEKPRLCQRLFAWMPWHKSLLYGGKLPGFPGLNNKRLTDSEMAL